MAKSDYQEANVLNGTLRTAAFAKPAGVYVALFTTAPDDAGGGTEVSGGGYTRIQHGPSDATWTAPTTGGSTANIGDVQFPDPSGANWGTVTHFALYDAATNGNQIYWGALSASKVINDGDGGPKFADGALQVTED
jgi:hypothetical protein